MVGLSDFGLYQRTLLVFNGQWTNVNPGQTNFGEPVKREPMVTVALDLSQGLWIARGQNWKLARGQFLRAVSGRAKTQYADVILETPAGDVIINQYFMNDVPRRNGPAFRNMHPMGGNLYAQRTDWWRYDDPSIMSPFDKMAEMFDRAVRSPRLKGMIASQVGGLISPEVLLPIAGTFFCLFGAEFVGGAAAALFVARLLGCGQLLCDYYFYEARGSELHHICMSGNSSVADIDYGARLIEEILCQILSDVATMLGIHALTSLAGRLFSFLARAAPEGSSIKIRQGMHDAAAYVRGKGYARRELLRDPVGTPLEPAAVAMYKKTSESNLEILVVREPDAQRAVWVQSTMHQNAKPTWLKARSADGWHGLVCLKKSDVTGTLKRASLDFDTAQVRGFNPALDAEHLPKHLPTYEMPLDGRPMGAGLDYHYTGHENIMLQGHKLVDLGDRLLVVDALGRPYVSDLDLATRQRPGASEAGSHLPARDGRGAVEDNPMLEWEMNQEYRRAGGNPTHDPLQHGGGGATVVYTRMNLKEGKVPGKDFWSPKTPDGYKKERLIIFVPEKVGLGIQSRMYALDSWGDFKAFAEANNMEFPF